MNMRKLSRRKLITTGLAATAGASGLAVAASLARRYGLIPPDGGGLYGPGETLTYAAQRLLTRHSQARELGFEDLCDQGPAAAARARRTGRFLQRPERRAARVDSGAERTFGDVVARTDLRRGR